MPTGFLIKFIFLVLTIILNLSLNMLTQNICKQYISKPY